MPFTTPEGKQFAKEVQFVEARAERALGFYRFVFVVEVNAWPQAAEHRDKVAPPMLADLDGSWSVKHPGGFVLAGRLTTAGAELPLVQDAENVRRKIALVSDLDGLSIDMVDALRDHEGDLHLKLSLRGGVAQGWRACAAEETVHATIEQGRWVRMLTACGFRRTLLLEVPFPPADADPRMHKAVEHLSNARQLMLEGRHRSAVGECRDVLESLSLSVGDGNDVHEAAAALFRNSKAMTKAERLAVLRRALKLLTHPARHVDEVTAQFEWHPEDARAVISMCAALIAWVPENTPG